jgi:bifunctional UDP-N-acetylglucosamine pyrophosphorylase / glucosamine-1-phosphate N-acetyltransferase
MTTDERPLVAVVLAAGKGTRMKSSLPKVLHPVAGKPMLGWVLAAARAAGCTRIVVVVGHGGEQVRAAFAHDDLQWVVQREQLGTGHALLQAEDAVRAAGRLLVLSGDVPLLRAETLAQLLDAAASGWGAMAVAELAEPGALGRVVAHPGGTLDRIVEVTDASASERSLRLTNAGLYALPAPEIFTYLRALRSDNAKGEFYLTAALNAAARACHVLHLVPLADPSEGFGVNDRVELSAAHRVLLDRHSRALQLAGVTILDAASVTIEPSVEIAADSVIHPGVSLLGATTVGTGCTIHQGVWLRDTAVAGGATVEAYTVADGARIGPRCRIGPFARLRPGTVLEEAARIGNFVEVKNSTLGAGSKANHLAYVGDASVGAGANLGAGVITCNYDGERKHKTEIGADAFIGSDTMLVAPVTVGERASTAAGSVVNQDVPAGALAVGRAKQRNLPGWADRKRGAKPPKEE